MHSHKAQLARIGFMVLAALLALSAQPAVAADNNVFGYWKRLDEDSGKTQSIFRLWEDKGKLVGKIVKVIPMPGKKTQTVCTDCPGAQAGKPVNGLLFLWGFSREEGNAKKWIDGKVLNPENGKTYNAEITLSDDGKTLNVYGYIRMLVKLGGNSVWQRATPEDLQGL